MNDNNECGVHIEPIDFDDVLKNELGEFGKFQAKNLLLVYIIMALSALQFDYTFTAMAVNSRCHIPECESIDATDFSTDWLVIAVPVDGLSNYESCKKYSFNSTYTNITDFSECTEDMFDYNDIVGCSSNMYQEQKKSMVYDFDLGCSEWRRAIIGSIVGIGMLLSLPLTGYLSDKYGRKTVTVLIGVNACIFGTIRAFSVNYYMFAVLLLLQSTFGGAGASAAMIIIAELMGPKYRVVGSILCSTSFACGQIVMGTLAWLIPDWRTLILTLYVPQILTLSYICILNESVRWMISKRRFCQARLLLLNFAQTNGRNISEKTMERLFKTYENDTEELKKKKSEETLFTDLKKSKTVLKRVLTTPVWWISSVLIYYGLSLNSIGLNGNRYINYILVVAIELPGYWGAFYLLDRIGRKKTLAGGFFICATCQAVYLIVSNDYYVVSLILFLLGKLTISSVMISLYVYTSELYPTCYRHSLLAFSSMVGRVGTTLAPLTPTLALYWYGIPYVIFGVLALVSGLLVLTTPETLGTKLPDTMKDAERVGS